MKKIALAIAVITITLFLGGISMPAHASETVIYSEGFESSNGGYTHAGVGTSDQWEWGVPNYMLGPVSAHSGILCWGTNLDGAVPHYTECVLLSPQITLPSIGADQSLRAKFYAWLAIDDEYDRGWFEVSSDGLVYVSLAELSITMDGQWSAYDFDISTYAGGIVYLRFRIYTDGNDNFYYRPVNNAGLYIDDVEIDVQSLNAPPTTNPVIITDLTSGTPTISWTYGDLDNDPQSLYEVEVWTGPVGTGTQMWATGSVSGTSTSVVYAGSSLIPGSTYYARVRAFDGKDWGQWSESSFVLIPSQVIPEVPLGTVVSSISMMIALLAYLTIPRLKVRRRTRL